VHHSEDITYFDEFENGWVELYTRQRVPDGSSSHTYLSETRLCIQLPGVPVDTSRYLNLSRYTGNPFADFRVVHEHPCQTVRLKSPVKLDVVGTLVRTYYGRKDDRWVVGLIVRNPFFQKKKLPAELQLQGELNDLLQMELIFCDMKDHIGEGDEVDQYTLQGFETMQAHYTQIIRPFGTWSNITRSVRDGQPVSETNLKSMAVTIAQEVNLKRSKRESL
jgi:hypothetical protein